MELVGGGVEGRLGDGKLDVVGSAELLVGAGMDDDHGEVGG